MIFLTLPCSNSFNYRNAIIFCLTPRLSQIWLKTFHSLHQDYPQTAFNTKHTGLYLHSIVQKPFGLPMISEVSRMLTHLLTDDLVVETQIAGGGSADRSSSI